MRFARPSVVILLALGCFDSRIHADESPLVVVESGRFERRDSPVRLDIDRSRLAPLDPGRALALSEVSSRPGSIPVQVEPIPGDERHLRLTFVLAGTTPPGASRRFRLEAMPDTESPWSLENGPDGSLALANRGKPVFRYNVSLVEGEGYPPIQRRNAYIHPAYSPSGALITGDFSRFHPHHRGFFLAYAKARRGDQELDFWNIPKGTGKVHCDHLGPTTTGPVTAHFTTFHRWENGQGEVVLNERWEVEAYDIPGSPYWLFDLTSTQQAVGQALGLVPYRYGGMAYRGPDPFQPAGVLDVLTSDGLTRQDADQKPARWVDLTGPIESGSDHYAGAMMADHPSNVNHPTVARIHPTTLPFFSYVPAHDKPVTIDTDHPTIFRYRILIHDGHPDRERDERAWQDFAEPPTVHAE